jgi:hypothetical protein
MSEAESPPFNPARGRIVLWLAGLGVSLLLLLAWWPGGKGHARPALPNPNGFDYFVKAGDAMSGMWTNASPRTLPAHDLQAYLSANSPSLELVREGLRHMSHTHMDYDATYIARSMTNLGALKRLGVLLAGEGCLAELEGKPAAALESYFDGMRLGQECSRGGVVMERLMGLAIEFISLRELRVMVPKLDVLATRRCLERLLQLDGSHDSPTVNLAAEDEWISRAFPLYQRVITRIAPVTRKDMRDTRDRFSNKVESTQAERRRAIVEAAARLFELEKGRRPKSYTDLVPAYLKVIPLDPTTGKEIAHPF